MKRGLKAEDFEEFNVTVADGFTMPYTRVVKQLKMTLGDYDFYVVGIGRQILYWVFNGFTLLEAIT